MKRQWLIHQFGLLVALIVSLVSGDLAAESPSAPADTSSIAFDAANKLYEQGKFADAAAAYAQLAKNPSAGAAIHYNLGNALFKSGQIGRAIAAYHKAEQLAPHDPDVRANLRFARSQAQGPTLAPSRWAEWLDKLSLNEWTLLVTAVFWSWFLCLALQQWRPSMRSTLRGYVLTLFAATAAFGFCLGSAYYHARVARTAIVVSPEAVVRYGPLDESQTAFTAHDGAEFRILDQKDGWLELTDGVTRTGWVRQDLVLVSPQG
jgi:tetratricopeptide (TPR) repeat protein